MKVAHIIELTEVIEEDYTALVINSSQEMAKEITLQLSLQNPTCSITYAPTFEIARFILERRKIHLVVSSPVLPDGSIMKLKDTIEKLTDPPNVVVVGNLNERSKKQIEGLGYRSSLHRISPSKPEKMSKKIENLGADIRNDLNNPLQEIVAMVFVAKQSEVSPLTDQALQAIDKAAQNMAKVVSTLQNKLTDIFQ